jgi:hypothetical protein
MKFIPVETDQEAARIGRESMALSLFREFDAAEQYRILHILAAWNEQGKLEVANGSRTLRE